MQLGLEGKVAVVTGASRGIGLAVVRALRAEGVHVVAGARTPGAELAAVGATPVAVDLATSHGPATLVSTAIDAHGGVDVLVNNVGGGRVHMAGPLAVTDDEWRSSLDINLFSAIRACRAAVPSMLARGGGAIVSISSINGFLPEPTAADYSAAKAALVSFSKALSRHHARDGIRANVISPGLTATPMWLGDGGVAHQLEQAGEGTREDIVAGAEAEVPIGRFLEADEVAAMVVVLASGVASGMTGADVVVDGGSTPTT
jgi:NAD(P)-dependent dehydrogenase (short-subunit alcohol dehydrogenase family)